MMSSQILKARQSKGISFHYKFPKTGVSLRSVAIEEDGLPKLIFDGANCRELPTLTEEDIATVARVVTEGKRPEFFYRGFSNPTHPFFDYDRMYKRYSPQWLRGTSVGDLLSEADWSMKCLNVGTRSNESKTKFWSWKKTSKLDDLAVHMDFPCGDRRDGSILMSCDSIQIEQSETEIFFIDEPKMKITCEAKPMYSKYISEYFYNVAYYDEPLFLKMQELMKLIVAIEWMKDKGIVFNKKWLNYHTEKKNPRLQSQAITIKPIEETDQLMKQAADMLKKSMEELHTDGPFGPVSSKVELTRQTPTGIELTVTNSCPVLSLQEETSLRISFNDYNFLYEGFDCKQPFTLDHKDGRPIIPDVSSWSELFAETVPMPHTIGVLHNTEGIVTNSGGITTQNIPMKTKKVVKTATRTDNTVSVKASHDAEIQSQPQVTPVKVVSKPKTNVPARTFEARCNKESISSTRHGVINTGQCSMHSETEITNVEFAKMAGKQTTKMNGNTINETRCSSILPIPAITEEKKRKKSQNMKKLYTASSSSLKNQQDTQQDTRKEQECDCPVETGNDPSLLPNSIIKPKQEVEPLRLPEAENIPAADTKNSPPLSLTPTDSGIGSPTSTISDQSMEENLQEVHNALDAIIFQGGVNVDLNNREINDSDKESKSDDELGTESGSDTEMEDSS